MLIKSLLTIVVLMNRIQVSIQYYDIKQTQGVMHMNYDNQFDIFHQQHSLLLVAFISHLCNKCNQAIIAIQKQIPKLKNTPFHQIQFAMVDVHEEQSMAFKYKVTKSVPQFMVFERASDKTIFRMPEDYSMQQVFKKLFEIQLERERIIDDL